MARPMLKDRTLLRDFRLTVKIPHGLEARLKAAASKRYEGNFSQLVRVAVDKLVTEIENEKQEA